MDYKLIELKMYLKGLGVEVIDNKIKKEDLKPAVEKVKTFFKELQSQEVEKFLSKYDMKLGSHSIGNTNITYEIRLSNVTVINTIRSGKKELYRKIWKLKDLDKCFDTLSQLIEKAETYESNKKFIDSYMDELASKLGFSENRTATWYEYSDGKVDLGYNYDYTTAHKLTMVGNGLNESGYDSIRVEVNLPTNISELEKTTAKLLERVYRRNKLKLPETIIKYL